MNNQFENPTRLFVIGGGKMGEAILGGALASKAFKATQVHVVEPTVARGEALEQEYGITSYQSIADLQSYAPMQEADIVLLAVKPQVMPTILPEVAGFAGKALIISIAVGLTLEMLDSGLGAEFRVVKSMPNTPALVGKGVALLSKGTYASEEDLSRAVELFRLFGSAEAIPEEMQDAGAAISGSGPAYFALVIDALSRAGVAQGLSRDLAQRLAVQTMEGTAKMIAETKMHPEELVDMVSSPGGTTIAAVNELEKGQVRASFAHAIKAAVKRAKKLRGK